MTQVEFAKKLNVTPVAANKWLKGNPIESSKIPLICEALDITPNELFGIENNNLSTEEKRVLKAYQDKPEYQDAIKKY